MLVATVNNQCRVMSRAYLRAIFKPLVQGPVDATDTRPTTSLGLGLYIAHQIADAHGGDISVTSDDAIGTTFTVRIPREPQPESVREGRRSPDMREPASPPLLIARA